MDTKADGYKGKVEKLMKKGIVTLEVIKDWEEKLSSTRYYMIFLHLHLTGF